MNENLIQIETEKIKGRNHFKIKISKDNLDYLLKGTTNVTTLIGRVSENGKNGEKFDKYRFEVFLDPNISIPTSYPKIDIHKIYKVPISTQGLNGNCTVENLGHIINSNYSQIPFFIQCEGKPLPIGYISLKVE